MHTNEQILRAAAEWTWTPRGSMQDTDQLRLTRYPERLGGGVRASQVNSESPADEVLSYAIERTRAWGASEITFWTNPADSPDIEEALIRRGAQHVDTVTVFACAIAEVSLPVDDFISVEVVRTGEQVREVDTINVPVWGQTALDENGLAAELQDVTSAFETGLGIQVLARLGGEAVSVGGCTIVDGFVRLWGGATLESARGRGAYRAVLAERIRVGSERGATTALVKGRVSTSAPIIASAGFQRYGDERAYRLTVE